MLSFVSPSTGTEESSVMREERARLRVLRTTVKRNVIGAPRVAILWLSNAKYRLLLDRLVCMGTITVAVQALRSQEYGWALGFLAIAALFNPFVPVLKPEGHPPLSLVFVYIATFVTSLAALNMQTVPAGSGIGPGSPFASFSQFLMAR
jgi:uncharacterized protein DUF6804